MECNGPPTQVFQVIDVSVDADDVDVNEEIQRRAQSYEAALRNHDERIASLQQQIRAKEDAEISREQAEAEKHDMRMLRDLCRQQVDATDEPNAALTNTTDSVYIPQPPPLAFGGKLTDRIAQLRG